jgi:hypothetical protein
MACSARTTATTRAAPAHCFPPTFTRPRPAARRKPGDQASCESASGAARDVGCAVAAACQDPLLRDWCCPGPEPVAKLLSGTKAPSTPRGSRSRHQQPRGEGGRMRHRRRSYRHEPVIHLFGSRSNAPMTCRGTGRTRQRPAAKGVDRPRTFATGRPATAMWELRALPHDSGCVVDAAQGRRGGRRKGARGATPPDRESRMAA